MLKYAIRFSSLNQLTSKSPVDKSNKMMICSSGSSRWKCEKNVLLAAASSYVTRLLFHIWRLDIPYCLRRVVFPLLESGYKLAAHQDAKYLQHFRLFFSPDLKSSLLERWLGVEPGSLEVHFYFELLTHDEMLKVSLSFSTSVTVDVEDRLPEQNPSNTYS